MHGGLNWQVTEVFKVIFSQGQSKHLAKQQARQQGAKTWHQVGKEINIYSYKTFFNYKQTAKDCLSYTKEKFGVKDIEKLTSQHIKEFLQSKIDRNVAKGTLKTYASSLQKLEVALNKYAKINQTGRTYDFTETISQVCKQAYKDGNLPEINERYGGSRAYKNPDKIINALKDKKHRITAKLQKESGLRIREANLIKKEQLVGENRILIAKAGAKGGRIREVEVRKQLYEEVKAVIEEEGRFYVNQNRYREELKETCQELQEDYYGTHGFRWNYAQQQHQENMENDMTYEQSLNEISEEMGHSRADITEHYLK